MIIRMDEYLNQLHPGRASRTKPAPPPQPASLERDDEGPNEDPPAAFQIAA
jgi:hypothetical protein